IGAHALHRTLALPIVASPLRIELRAGAREQTDDFVVAVEVPAGFGGAPRVERPSQGRAIEVVVRDVYGSTTAHQHRDDFRVSTVCSPVKRRLTEGLKPGADFDLSMQQELDDGRSAELACPAERFLDLLLRRGR